MWSSLVLMTDSTVTHLILHGWWETAGIIRGTGGCECTSRGNKKIVDGSVALALFSRLALHFSPGCEWEPRAAVGGSDFALNMLSVVSRMQILANAPQVQPASERGNNSPANYRRRGVYNTFFKQGMRERERENPA